METEQITFDALDLLVAWAVGIEALGLLDEPAGLDDRHLMRRGGSHEAAEFELSDALIAVLLAGAEQVGGTWQLLAGVPTSEAVTRLVGLEWEREARIVTHRALLGRAQLLGSFARRRVVVDCSASPAELLAQECCRVELLTP